jgi:hypothetical protein
VNTFLKIVFSCTILINTSCLNTKRYVNSKTKISSCDYEMDKFIYANVNRYNKVIDSIGKAENYGSSNVAKEIRKTKIECLDSNRIRIICELKYNNLWIIKFDSIVYKSNSLILMNY